MKSFASVVPIEISLKNPMFHPNESNYRVFFTQNARLSRNGKSDAISAWKKSEPPDQQANACAIRFRRHGQALCTEGRAEMNLGNLRQIVCALLCDKFLRRFVHRAGSAFGQFQVEFLFQLRQAFHKSVPRQNRSRRHRQVFFRLVPLDQFNFPAQRHQQYVLLSLLHLTVSYCFFGFKPSVGTVTCNGIVPLVPSQDAPGPLGRSVDDLALIFDVIKGPDCRDGQTLSGALHLWKRPQEYRHPKSIRIGVPRRLIADRPDLASVITDFEGILSELSKAGVTIVDPCDFPAAEQLHEVRSSVFRIEFKAALNAFFAENESPCGIGSMADLIDFNEQTPSAIPYGQSLLKLANDTAGLSDPSYIADRRRDIALSRLAGIDAALWFSEADVLIAPMGAAAKCTGKAGAPVLAIPSGLGARGEPFGVTVFASRGSDDKVLNVGAMIASIVSERVLPAL